LYFLSILFAWGGKNWPLKSVLSACFSKYGSWQGAARKKSDFFKKKKGVGFGLFCEP